MKPISIRFPMTTERTGARRGPRTRTVPDKTGLRGAALCAASMIAAAMVMRDGSRRETATPYSTYCRAAMRSHALWARVFAGQIHENDPRLLKAEAVSHAIAEPLVPAAA